MKKCIFCGKTENEFDNNNCWTIEHIIPEALGNETLKLYNVCKNCNSGLGAYVDNYFVNHTILKLIRQYRGLKGHSGKIPNAFSEGKDENGQRIRVDENFAPSIVPSMEQKGNEIKIVASSKDEAKKMIKKKFNRLNLSKEKLQDALDKIDQAETNVYQPRIQYDFEVDIDRFFMEALKIAFEYIIYKFGDRYLDDLRAKAIQDYLKKAIDGKMNDECETFSGVFWTNKCIEEILMESKKKSFYKRLNFHILVVYADNENKLNVEVILFLDPALSFSVIVSEDANKYYSSKKPLVEIVNFNSSKK